MKLKVINIVNHPPAYDGHRGRPRPKINWDTPAGSWVGIWGYEWHDIIGNKVLSVASNDINYEVWQPDQRADKIYEHTFESGLVHKLFPAINKKFKHGLKTRIDIYSETLMKELDKEASSGNPLVLHINAGHRFINVPILNKYYNKVPIVGQFYTNSIAIYDFKKSYNPAKSLNNTLKKKELDNYYTKLKFIIPSISEGIEEFEKKFGTKIFYRDCANFGGNFDGWNRKLTKEEAKKKLNIPADKHIFFSSSRLISVKQVDKLIEALSNLKNQDFICYVSGRGEEQYEAYLNKLVTDNQLEGKVVFIGYVDLNILQEYFQAVDLVLSTSFQDAGPSSPFQAATTGTPCLLTETGLAHEFFKKNNAGIIVPVDDYQKWTEELELFMNGKEVVVPSQESLIAYADWSVVAKYYYNIYKTLQNTTL